MSAPALRVLALVATVHALDQTQLERYAEHGRLRRYQLDVPGKQPITIVETDPTPSPRSEWIDITLTTNKDRDEIRNVMTDIIHDPTRDKPRCYGPSCQEGFIEEEGPHADLEEYLSEYADKIKDYRDYSSDRLQAISALATKLKNERLKVDYFAQSYPSSATTEQDNNGKVYTAWNKLKVKKHKHPYDDKDGWVTLEPVAWSTSKISKWKPNIKKQKPMSWNDDEDRYSSSNNNDAFYQASESVPSYPNPPHKKPSVIRPAYINNKLHMSTTTDWDMEVPSKPSWNNKPQAQATYNYPSTWSPDDSRRPLKPTCDSEEHQNNEDSVYYGISDSVVTDNRPSQFPYEYEALKRPLRRPTQVVYAGTPEIDNDRTTRPSFGHGNGQWVLLSTTKGYRNKKRQRSLSSGGDDGYNQPTVTSHQAVALTVLPADSDHTNMTTSHGGLLEVERSFKTVEESKRDIDKENELRPDMSAEASNSRPSVSQVMRRRVVGAAAAPDSAAVLAAVGAGMVPATMAMVVPMMIGRRRRRRDITRDHDEPPYKNTYFKFE